MPLPYKEPGSALMSLVQNMAETGQRVGGTSELQVGEGRADAAVGTTLAMIEQATKVMNAVHKRLHAAQAEEFQLLVRCFREHPESFWQRCKRPTVEWNEQTFMQALDDCMLVPQADPNTASHTQRIMKIMALKQLQAGAPELYNAYAIDTAALKAMGWSNPEQFMTSPDQPPPPTPEMMAQLSKAENDGMRARATMMDAQTRQQEAQAKVGESQQKLILDKARAQADIVKTQTEVDYFETDASAKRADIEAREKDRASQERIQLIDLAQNLAVHPESAPLIAPLIEPALREIEETERSGGLGAARPNFPPR